MTTLNTGVNDEDGFDDYNDDEAAEALLARWTDANKPSDTNEGKTPKKKPAPAADEEDTDDDLDFSEDEDAGDDPDEEDEGSDTDQSDDDADEDDDSEEALEATDDHKVSVTIDGETKTVTVKDLKRLFGQEASLTRKSQEVATQRKAAEADAERYMVATQRLIAKAEERFAPFAEIDWMIAQQRLTPDEFSALRTEARAAQTDLNFLNTEANSVLETIRTERQQANTATAQETIKVMEKDVPGWNQDVYNKVLQHAVASGMDAQFVTSIVDAPALKLLHQAMRFSELKAKAAQKKTVQKAAPKRVVKPSNTSNRKIGKTDKGADQASKFQKSRSRDDAEALLMARWTKGDDD
jgi:hypothetical protein